MAEQATGAVPARVAFGARLAAAMAEHGQLCVGIDPHPGLLKDWGLPDSAAGVREFSARVLDAASSRVAALKPQVALFERHGSAGLAALEDFLADAAEAGVLSIADAKRGDIGSTMQAYAQAWLGEGAPLAADSLTVSPYLGFGSLEPALALSQETGRGLFVLALTSNPEGPSVQHARTAAGESVAASIVAQAGLANAGVPVLGNIGLVIGATVGSAIKDLALDLAGLNGPILAPGLGAQGATAADLKASFGAAYPQVLATSSRDILAAGPDRASLQAAIERTRSGLR